jgi:predicted GNAT family acetyltransferase
LRAGPLDGRHQAEVLAFLARRPIHTVVMAGMIRDNGLESSLNRGSFYACRDASGRLEGVALIGHITLVETDSEAALEAFARLAQEYGRAHVILGEREKVSRFWAYYAPAGQLMRSACRELLLEQSWPVEVREPIGLRTATVADLEQVMPVHAQLAYEESGVNPLERDPEGFRRRCARRIEQGRTWVCVENGKLIFKAEVVSETPETVYVEGVWVSPGERGKGYGLRCMSQLARTLLARSGSICILVNERNERALTLYRKSGLKLRGHYDTIFLQH